MKPFQILLADRGYVVDGVVGIDLDRKILRDPEHLAIELCPLLWVQKRAVDATRFEPVLMLRSKQTIAGKRVRASKYKEL